MSNESGPGTPLARLSYLLDNMHVALGLPEQLLSSAPPEIRLMNKVREVMQDRAECKAHVARLESELLNLRQQHARDQKESLEHVRKACRERDETRAELALEGACMDDASRLVVDCLVATGIDIVPLAAQKWSKEKADELNALRRSLPGRIRSLVVYLAEARAQLLQSDREIATAIERARVAEAHAALTKKAMEVLRIQIAEDDPRLHGEVQSLIDAVRPGVAEALAQEIAATINRDTSRNNGERAIALATAMVAILDNETHSTEKIAVLCAIVRMLGVALIEHRKRN